MGPEQSKCQHDLRTGHAPAACTDRRRPNRKSDVGRAYRTRAAILPVCPAWNLEADIRPAAARPVPALLAANCLHIFFTWDARREALALAQADVLRFTNLGAHLQQ